MVLKEKEAFDIIDSYTKAKWEHLFEFIPLLESKYSNLEKLSNEIMREAYNIPIMIGFNWNGWDEGREIASNVNFDYDSIDIFTKCKLLTALIRNDRFCEGVFLSYVKSGLILKILKSIKKQVYSKEV
jgi:hypothetical protein